MLNSRPLPGSLKVLTVITILGLLVTLYLGLFFVGTDVEQGAVQRLFYIHMPAFFGAFTAFGATVVGGIMYLTKRDPKWDRLAVAGVEVGLALSLVNLLTGIAWMRPIWNSWWLWDPRLTSAAIMVSDLRCLFDVAGWHRKPGYPSSLCLGLWHSGDYHRDFDSGNYPHSPGYDSPGSDWSESTKCTGRI